MNVLTTPFSKKVPSVFVVSSPFQALCAVATIRQLELDNYKLIAHLPKGVARNKQVENYLKKEGIEYVRYTPNRFSNRYYTIMSYYKGNSGYDRLFIGNHNDVEGFYRGCYEIKKGASVVYLDDGVQSISHFKGVLKERQTKATLKRLEQFADKRHLEIFKYYITIYDGIPNSNFCIEKLHLHHVLKKQDINKEVKGVVIVGVVLNESCKIYNMTAGNLGKKIEELIMKLKIEYPNEPIIYVPHGRDEGDWAIQMCNKHSCEYRKCDRMIEMSLAEDVYIPKVIVGYSSSALYSLKQIFPQTRVVNVLYESAQKSDLFNEKFEISNYYSEHGIEMLVEKI